MICAQPSEPIEVELGVKVPFDTRVVCHYNTFFVLINVVMLKIVEANECVSLSSKGRVI